MAEDDEAIYLRAKERALRMGCHLAAAKQIDPYIQGDLDNLCGLYSAVNALRLIAEGRGQRLSELNSQKLFRHGASFLEQQSKLSAAVRFGLSWRLWVKLVGDLTTKAGRMLGGDVLLQQPFTGMDGLNQLIFIANVRAVLRDRKAVLILLRGEYEHFTVISGLTTTRLRLFDSYGYHWVTLASCATMGKVGATRHRIHIPSFLVMGP